MKLQSLKVDYDTPLAKQCADLGIQVYIDLEKVTHDYPRPENDTIFDVRDGSDVLGLSPNEAEKKLKEQGRRGLTLYEALALYRFDTSILKRHNADVVGSRHKSGYRLSLCLYDGEPELGASWSDGAGPEWGAWSCGSEKLDSRNLDPVGSPLDPLALESRIKELETFRERVEGVLKLNK